MQKRPCTVHLVHVKESHVVKINPEFLTAACLIMKSWFRHVKPQNIFWKTREDGHLIVEHCKSNVENVGHQLSPQPLSFPFSLLYLKRTLNFLASLSVGFTWLWLFPGTLQHINCVTLSMGFSGVFSIVSEHHLRECPSSIDFLLFVVNFGSFGWKKMPQACREQDAQMSYVFLSSQAVETE